MAIKFNGFNSYNNYNFAIGQKASQDAQETKKAEESNEIKKSETTFKGLENETDLLTKNPQSLYGVISQNSTQKIKLWQTVQMQF